MIDRLSLRGRLLGALLIVVAVGLVLVDMLIYAQLRGYLLDQVDRQLLASRSSVLRALDGGHRRPFGPAPSGPSALPSGTYGELRSRSGAVLGTVMFDDDQEPNPVPDLPAELPALGRIFSAPAIGDDLRFRVVANRVGKGHLVVAIPLAEVERTLDRLVVVEVTVSVGVLAAMAALSWWLVKVGLRPLREIEDTAGAIAGGDLSRRIDRADADTEVGRLGMALNSMLAQIEGAFVERQASEERLRRFLADASHELRTPLTSIRGYAELFRRGADARPEDLAKAMRRIEDEASRMGVLVDDLLLLARLDQGRPLEREVVDLAAIAVDAVSDATVVHPERVVEVEAPEPVVVVGDDVRLRQVATNLVANALHHTPEGTPVTVRVRAERSADAAVAVLEVVDRGEGLSAEDRARVFERFFRADRSRSRSRGGAGLGLAIVAAIAEAHGGRAEVDSTPGQGSMFRVVLPAVTSPAPARSVTTVPK